MSKKVIGRYCRAVKRLLLCRPRSRRRLIRGLREELAELPEEQTRSIDALTAHYGGVPETAEALQEAVSPEERFAAIKRRRVFRRSLASAAGALILALALAVVFLLFTPRYSQSDITLGLPYSEIKVMH